MDCNGLLWIFRNPVNGFEDTSMDCYGVFSGRRPDNEVAEGAIASVYADFWKQAH